MVRSGVFFWCAFSLAILLPRCELAKSNRRYRDYFQEIRKAYTGFVLGKNKNIVLVLGENYTRKTAATLLIAGARLESVREDIDYFSIKDEGGLIGDEDSQILPNLIVDNSTKVEYYDFPGFAENRDIVIDITATRCMYDLLNFAKTFKVLVAVMHQSVEFGSYKESFFELARHMTNLFDVTKYGKSFGMVVTRVSNYDEHNNPINLDDEMVIESIAKFLQEAKVELEGERDNTMTEEERTMNEEMIKFTEIFLERDSTTYTRISILRPVKKSGLLQEMPEIVSEKKRILNILNNNLKFVSTGDKDFGYSLSDRSVAYAGELLAKLNQQIVVHSDSICAEIKTFYGLRKPFNKSVADIQADIGVDNFFKLKSNSELITKFKQSALDLGIQINSTTLTNLSKSVDFSDFIHKTSKLDGFENINGEMKGRLISCAKDLFHDVEAPLRKFIPKAITDLLDNYIDSGQPDPYVLGNLTKFLSVGLNESAALNSTILRSLLNDRSNAYYDELSLNIEFVEFAQMLSDAKSQFSLKMSNELKRPIRKIRKQTESTLYDSINSVFRTIRAFCFQLEKKNFLNLEKAYQLTSMVTTNVSRIRTESFETLVSSLFEVVDGLRIHTLIENRTTIFRTVEFLKALSPDVTSLPVPSGIIENLNKLKKYVRDTPFWFSFLIDLREHLLTYDVQKGTLREKGDKLMSQSISSEDDSRNATEIGLEPMLKSFGITEFTNTAGIEEVNKYKLKALQAIWAETMFVSYSCSSDELVAKGSVILISNIIKLDCWSKAKRIDVFALSTIYVDADVDKDDMQAEISMISPLWEIIARLKNENRLFNLRGVQGDAYSAEADRSRAGSPGKPGYPGGNFLGIANSFENSQKLRVDVTGGRGGTGQKGGKGADGIRGRTPPRPKDDEKYGYVEYVQAQGFKTKHYPERTKTYTLGLTGEDKYNYYDVFGKFATSAGAAGAGGGCGGKGGKPGKYFITGLDRAFPVRVRVVNQTGPTGYQGSGGEGGAETRHGTSFYIKLYSKSRSFQSNKYYYTILTETKGGVIPAGDKGKDGTNCEGIKDSATVTFHMTSSITRYQEYARNNLANITLTSDVLRFLGQLTNNKIFDSFFGLMDLINEFNSLEQQYFSLHKKVDLVPFYKSLKSRIERFIRQIGESEDERETVRLLYTSVVSKLGSMEFSKNQIFVTKLLAYIDTIKGDIAKLKENKKVEFITNLRDSYKSSLDDKMSTANKLIKGMILPAIDSTFEEIEYNIGELLQEAVDLQKMTEKQLEVAKENKRKLELAIQLHNALGPLKILGDLLSLAGPEGAIAGAVVSGGTSFAEKVIDGNLEPQKISTPTGPYRELIEKTRNDFLRQQVQFLKQLRDCNETLAGDGSAGFDDMRRILQNVTTEVDVTVPFQKKAIADITEKIDNAKAFIDGGITSTKTFFDDLKNKGQNVTKQLDRIGRIEKLMQVGDIGVNMYKAIKDDNSKLDEINSQIEDLQDQIASWKQQEANIKEIMLPVLHEIEDSFHKATKNLPGKEHVQLDITKWQMQSALSDMKKQFAEMAKAQSSILEGDFMHCIEKVSEGITTMIVIYDRIDTYNEQSKMVSLITDTATGPSKIKDSKFQKATENLQKIVQTNLIMERFESVMEALKIHQFPHAQLYMDVYYNIPPGLQSNETEKIAQTVSDRIDELRKNLISSDSSLELPDVNRFSNRRFDSSSPFFTWKHEDYEESIHKLLDGKEISLQADIEFGVSFTAVKFKEIAINFKMANETRQAQLNTILEQYEIVMTMAGNYYYRCNNRIYYVAMEKHVDLIFRIINGKIADVNDIYAKIKETDYFLSPYTVWNIQIRPYTYYSSKHGAPRNSTHEYSSPDGQAPFNSTSTYDSSTNLSQFKKDKIDLQLIGLGQVIKKEIPTAMNICSSALDRYYTLDKILQK